MFNFLKHVSLGVLEGIEHGFVDNTFILKDKWSDIFMKYNSAVVSIDSCFSSTENVFYSTGILVQRD